MVGPRACSFCLGTGIVRRDGSPRVIGGRITLRALADDFKPCEFCAEGRRETEWRRDNARYFSLEGYPFAESDFAFAEPEPPFD